MTVVMVQRHTETTWCSEDVYSKDVKQHGRKQHGRKQHGRKQYGRIRYERKQQGCVLYSQDVIVNRQFTMIVMNTNRLLRMFS